MRAGWPVIVLLVLASTQVGSTVAACVDSACAEHSRVEDGAGCDVYDGNPATRASYSNASAQEGDLNVSIGSAFMCYKYQEPNHVGAAHDEFMWTNVTVQSTGRTDKMQLSYYYGGDAPHCRTDLVVDPSDTFLVMIEYDPYYESYHMVPNCHGDEPSVAEYLP